MSKTRTRFVCQQCGRVTARLMGKCPQCGTFNSMVEEVIVEAPTPAATRRPIGVGKSSPQRLTQVEGDAEERWHLPLGEFSRVLGGGVVPGSLVLLGGDPGIGKSSLLMQASARVRARGAVLYVSGEESAAQVKLRARRFGIDGSGILLLAETDVGTIIESSRWRMAWSGLRDWMNTAARCGSIPAASQSISNSRVNSLIRLVSA